MRQWQRAIGWLWAAPLTACGLLYVNLFTLLGWYRRQQKVIVDTLWVDTYEDAIKTRYVETTHQGGFDGICC